MKKLLTLLLKGDDEMMKKMLILMLVLGLASTASAALTFQIATGPAPLSGDYAEVGDAYTLSAPSGTIWIGIYNDTQGSAQGGTQQFTALPRFIDTPLAEWTGGNAVYVPPAVPYAYNYYLGVLYGYDYWYSNMSNGVPTDFTGIGVTSGFEFHCLGEGPVIVELVEAGTGYVVDFLFVTQVPEPATIALLGLGGLFLRRRRK